MTSLVYSKPDALRLTAVFAASIAYWAFASVLQDAAEPWDSPLFLPTYGVAIGLSAACGWFFQRGAWRWGVLAIAGLLPVVVTNTGVGPLLPIGIGLTGLATIPAALASLAAARTRYSANF